jgi:hypothetical protein
MDERVAEYMGRMHHRANYILKDGFHRVEAASRLGREAR